MTYVDNTLYLPELREMLAGDDAAELREFCTALHPARTAEFMEGLTADEAWRVLYHAEPSRRAEIFSFFEPEKQTEIVATADRREVAALLGMLAADDRVDLLKLAPARVMAELLPIFPVALRREVMRLISYPEGTAGAIMTTGFARVNAESTVGEAVEEISRQNEELETIYYIYVLDDDDHLLGLISFRELVSHLGRRSARVEDLMERGLVTVLVTDDQERVASEVARFDLLAIPIVDEQQHMLGIVTHDDVIDVVREEAVKDAHRIAGVEPLEAGYLQTKITELTWKRGVWLTVMFFASMVTALALKSYDETLSGVQWLVLFLPMIISSGGNSGSQAATLVITALNNNHVRVGDWSRVIRRELVMGALLGAFLGLIGYAIVLLVEGEAGFRDALVLPISVLLVVWTGTLIGATLPILFARMGLDPAFMSNPCVTGIIDILGIVIYCRVAVAMLR